MNTRQQVDTVFEDATRALRKLCRVTGTPPEAWQHEPAGGSNSGDGEDFYFKHKKSGKSIYTCVSPSGKVFVNDEAYDLAEGWSVKPGEVYGNKTTTTNRMGEKVTATVGNPICFKSDVEQRSRVRELRDGGHDGRTPQVRVDVTQGEYRGKNRWLDLADCWN